MKEAGIVKKMGKAAKLSLAVLPITMIGIGVLGCVSAVISNGVNNTIVAQKIERYAETEAFTDAQTEFINGFKLDFESGKITQEELNEKTEIAQSKSFKEECFSLTEEGQKSEKVEENITLAAGAFVVTAGLGIATGAVLAQGGVYDKHFPKNEERELN